MAKKKKIENGKLDFKRSNEDKILAFVGSFFMLLGFLIILLLKKENKYAMFYAKQGLILFFGFAIAGIFSGMFFMSFIGNLFGLFIFVLWIISWINALSGKQKNIFLISDISNKIEI